jgi:hypothetical protein
MTFAPPDLRWAGRALIAPWLLALWSCAPTTAPQNSIAIVRLTIGEQTVLIDWDEGPRSAATIPPSGTWATQLTFATFHRSNGTPISLDPAEYEIRLEPEEDGLVEFERTEPFGGTLRRLTEGVAEVVVTVVHIPSGNLEFGPHTLTVN